MNAPFTNDWMAANQRLLSAEFSVLRRQLIDEPGCDEDPVLGAREAWPEPAAIDGLAAAFSLSPFERSVLLLAAGLEMDAGLRDGVPHASLGLALSKLAGAHWSALDPLAPLRAWGLLQLDGPSPTQARIRIDERILHFLAGVNRLDSRLMPVVRGHHITPLMHEAHTSLAATLAKRLVSSRDSRGLVQLLGNDRDGQLDVAADVASRMGRSLCVVHARDLPGAPPEQAQWAMLWQREAALLPAALLIDMHQQPSESAGALGAFLQRLSGFIFVASRDTNAVDFDAALQIDKPAPSGQRTLWLQALGQDAPAALIDEVDAVSIQFRLSAAQIVRLAQTSPDGLWAACREQTRPALSELAQRIDTLATWDKLVLPPAQLVLMHQLAAQLRQRLRVYAEWGFGDESSRGLGITALFHGESGVGKTLACEVLARELDLDLYRIDLSSVVSKYIGETEKNLRRLFDAAEDTGALLLFDEAEALFGKRSEVKDSHDRYANIEVGYLLQRMEAYRGLAVLTSNQRSALDPAFTRRLRFVVHFPFPDQAQRVAIWQRAFPVRTPCAGLDCDKLARLPLSGGQIRNIALSAAFMAATEAGSVGMHHIAQAARQEAAKDDRSIAQSQTQGWCA